MAPIKAIHAGKIWGIVDGYILEDRSTALREEDAIRFICDRPDATDWPWSHYVNQLPSLSALYLSPSTIVVVTPDGKCVKCVTNDQLVDTMIAYSAARSARRLIHSSQIEIAERCRAQLGLMVACGIRAAASSIEIGHPDQV